MSLELRDIPGLKVQVSALWSVRALARPSASSPADYISPVIDAIETWERTNQEDYKRIFRAITETTKVERNLNRKQVKKSHDKNCPDTYEFRAHSGVARVMFFYDEKRRLIVCTNTHDKAADQDQDAAFVKCFQLKQFYLLKFP